MAVNAGKVRAGLVVAAGLACVFGGMGVGGGCQQYSTYPAVASAEGMAESPNKPATEATMTLALQYVATRYAPAGLQKEPATPADAGKLTVDYPMVVNLPRGMRKSFYERIAKKVGPQVVPMTADVENGTLPVYHVTRVWLRFNTATVDVLRPMPEVGVAPGGGPVYQKVTVRLEGGFEPWRVVHARAWEPGTDPAPLAYHVPDVERIDQFEYTTKQDMSTTMATHPDAPVEDPSPAPAPSSPPTPYQ